jgi:Flp pilus assembly protein TadG
MRSARQGAVSLIFATALVPLLMVVGLAIDYGLYNEARSQLDMAADASALHAARVAAQLLQKNDKSFVTKAEYVGQQWFVGQLGSVPQAHSSGFSPIVNVTYAQSTNLITAQVNYSGVITAHFGSLFHGNWPYYPNWGIGGTATAVVSVPSYVEVLMLLDNSSSMLIAAYPGGITSMDSLTPCSTQAAYEGQSFDYNYSWAFIPTANGYISNTPYSAYSNQQAPNAASPTIMLPYGYGTFVYPSKTGTVISAQEALPPVQQVGQCDARFTGAAEGIPCPYPATALAGLIAPTTATVPGQCLNKGGGPGSVVYYPGTLQQNITPIPNMPQAPCAFACHTSASNDDYYGLAVDNGITLRFNVVRDAANQVVKDINSPSNPPGQISVGVYDFNGPLVSQNGNPALTGFTNDYPGGTVEADYNLTGASAAVTSITPPVTTDQADTDFPLAMTSLANIIKKTNGVGATKANPRKNLFIVTDGMQDYYEPSLGQACPIPPNALYRADYQSNGVCRVQGAIDAATYCQPIKDLGVTIYVLYTLYQPLPNPFYLTYDKQFAEPADGDPPIRTALEQCASSPNDFYEADQTDQIQPALLAMLAAALGSADRLTN